MTIARRESLREPSNAHHPGLILDCYLRDRNPVQIERPNARRDLFTAARTAMGSDKLKELYNAAFIRWQQSLPNNAVVLKFDYIPESKLILGLGRQNVLEAGLLLHHTYGVPYLPGSALKGLAAHFAHQVWGDDPDWKVTGSRHAVVFGAPKLDERPDMGGLIEFHDAWIVPGTLQKCLVDDVITPHHSAYYTAAETDNTAASEFDDPVPVSFLAIQAGFVVAVSKRDSRLPDEWLQVARQLIIESLTTPGWGIGGKTNAGYGLLKLNDKVRGADLQMSATTEADAVPAPEQQPVVRQVSPSDYRRDSKIKLRLSRLTKNGKWEAIIDETDQQVVIDPAEFPKKRTREFKSNAVLTFKLLERVTSWTALKLELE